MSLTEIPPLLLRRSRLKPDWLFRLAPTRGRSNWTTEGRRVGESPPARLLLAAGITIAPRYRDYAGPGVNTVSFSERPLLSGSGSAAVITIQGATSLTSVAAGDGSVRAGIFTVGPAFFQAMPAPLFAGREFEERDTRGKQDVAVVNQRFVKAFGLSNPLGRILATKNASYEIIGVVGDALFLNLKDAPRPMVYFPLQTSGVATYEIRTANNPLSCATTARRIVQQMDSRLAVSDLKTQTAHIDQAINQEIAPSRLGLLLAALELAIGCVGLYGTVGLNVARRTGEFGIRMTLERATLVSSGCCCARCWY